MEENLWIEIIKAQFEFQRHSLQEIKKNCFADFRFDRKIFEKTHKTYKCILEHFQTIFSAGNLRSTASKSSIKISFP